MHQSVPSYAHVYADLVLRQERPERRHMQEQQEKMSGNIRRPESETSVGWHRPRGHFRGRDFEHFTKPPPTHCPAQHNMMASLCCYVIVVSKLVKCVCSRFHFCYFALQVFAGLFWFQSAESPWTRSVHRATVVRTPMHSVMVASVYARTHTSRKIANVVCYLLLVYCECRRAMVYSLNLAESQRAYLAIWLLLPFFQLFTFNFPLTLYLGRCCDLAISQHKQHCPRRPMLAWLKNNVLFLVLIAWQMYLSFSGFFKVL